MPSLSADEVTQLLRQWSAGDQAALERLMPLVYPELRRLARRQMRRERDDHTLQTTALIHEAYMKLVDQRKVGWQNRAHFFAVAATLMRRILVDHARRRRYAKREGEGNKTPLDEAAVVSADPPADIVSIDEALDRLAALDPRQARVVELRFFGGLTVEETAEALGISEATVKREWSTARAWLGRELAKA